MTETSAREPRENWYFTFGAANPLAHYAVVIKDEWMAARQKMLGAFDRDWCGQYSAEEYHSKPMSYDLVIVNLDYAKWLYDERTAAMEANEQSYQYGLSQSREFGQGKP